MRTTHNKFDAEVQTWREIEKALSTVNHEKTQLVEKFKAAESARQSDETGLKTAEA